MNQSIFFRRIHTPIEAKGETLAELVAALNQKGEAADAFALDPAEFQQIPGAPFAYWASDSVRHLFSDVPPMEAEGRLVRLGDHPDDQDRYVRVFWEVSPSTQNGNRQWMPYQKGGTYSPYYADVHLLVDWDIGRETYYEFYGRPGRSSEHPSNYQLFFRAGLTWPRRTTSGISIRALPAGCIFADKGPTAFVANDDPDDLLALLAVMNSAVFEALVKLQLGAATAAARSYEVGIIQRTPVPSLADHELRSKLAALAREAHDLQRDRDRSDETTHAFRLPGLVQDRAASLREAGAALDAAAQAAAGRLAAIQSEIDDLAFDLYGLDEADRALVCRDMAGPPDAALAAGSDVSSTDRESGLTSDEEAEDELVPRAQDLSAHVQTLFQWCVGVVFGRWDARKALDPALLPSLGGPFDPLPRCAPGALVGPDGLPPAEAPASYPLPIAGDGILVDDPTHPADIVTRVRGVLALLWGERAAAIEREACGILGLKDLRDYFRDARQGFFAWHIKRYSKSRRKAPIYWLLQSERRAYALWLYAHRLTPTTLFTAARDYADVKVSLEEGRLVELRQGVESLAGSVRRQRERDIERGQKLVGEIQTFRDRLDRVALLNLPPHLSDGILISIAPLWELVPWKEARRMWEELHAGNHPWSTMNQQMRRRGLAVP